MAVKKMLFALPVMVLATGAFASNTVSFQGNIQTVTCDLSVNGGTTTPTVLVPTISTDAFQNNNFAVPTRFTVSARGCPVAGPEGNALRVFFSAQSDGDLLTMANAGTATGVGFAISSVLATNSYHQIGGTIAEVMPIIIPPGADGGTAEYYVGYLKKSYSNQEGSNPPVRPGTVRSTMQYSVEYL